MARVLITAFEPYDVWKENASWLALVELTRSLPASPEVTTRLYPVDYEATRERLERDLAGEFDYALHLGQAPGSTLVQLEAIGVNAANRGDVHEDCRPLADDGPVAYRSDLPLADWAIRLREAGVPARVSHHAGTYLCNAALYLSHYLCERRGWKTRSTFIHLPLAPEQVVLQAKPLPSIPSSLAALAIRCVLDELSRNGSPKLA